VTMRLSRSVCRS